VISFMLLLSYFGVGIAPGPIRQEALYVRGPSGACGIYLTVIPIAHNKRRMTG
jgi:hypothetical protein